MKPQIVRHEVNTWATLINSYWPLMVAAGQAFEISGLFASSNVVKHCLEVLFIDIETSRSNNSKCIYLPIFSNLSCLTYQLRVSKDGDGKRASHNESFWKLLDNAAFLRTHLEIKQVESLSTEFDSLSHGLGICQGAAFPCPGTGIIMSYVYITLLRFRAEILVNMGMLTLIMATLG